MSESVQLQNYLQIYGILVIKNCSEFAFWAAARQRDARTAVIYGVQIAAFAIQHFLFQ